MPYKIKPAGNGYKVTEASSGAHPGKVFSKHPQTKAMAEAQRAAILANTKGEGKKPQKKG
jgi:hypothetical protein